MSLERAMHRKPGETGRNAGGRGEAESEAMRDEARTARHETASPGRDGLLAQALSGFSLRRIHDGDDQAQGQDDCVFHELLADSCKDRAEFGSHDAAHVLLGELLGVLLGVADG